MCRPRRSTSRTRSSSRRCTRSPDRVPIVEQLRRAAELIRHAARPLIIAGGGVHYSRRRGRADPLRRDPQRPRRRDDGRQGVHAGGPPAQRRAGRRHRMHVGQRARRRRPMSSSPSAPACRTSRPVRGRRSPPSARFVGINAAGFDAVKHSPHRSRRRCPRVPARAVADRRRLARTVRLVRSRRARDRRRITPTSTRSPRPPRTGCPPTPRWSARSTGSPSRTTTR